MVAPAWHARGLIFENCNCQLLCPGHVSFRNDCTHERCQGHWAIHIEEGRFGDVDLAALNAVDERAIEPQRAAVDSVLSGRAGGPWAILGRFVETRLETRYVPMRFEDDDREKRLTIPDLFETTVTAIRGADRQSTATIENLHNVLHGATHVVSRGSTRCSDRAFDFANDQTHGLYSRFSWTGGDVAT